MKKEFIVERNGKSFVLYAGLLDTAHERGLKAITTTLVQIPSDLNAQVAIVHATVETSQGAFTGIGDAAPDSVSRMMVPHLIRMAETRAKARALRDAVNVGVTALEELGELDDDAKAAVALGFPPRPPADEEEPHELDQPGNRRAAPREEPPHYRETNRTYGGQSSGGAQRPGAAPATPKQLQTIQRMARAAGKPVPTENLTRAQASEVISSLIGELDQGAGSGRSGRFYAN